jgi:hypothetical protein
MCGEVNGRKLCYTLPDTDYPDYHYCAKCDTETNPTAIMVRDECILPSVYTTCNANNKGCSTCYKYYGPRSDFGSEEVCAPKCNIGYYFDTSAGMDKSGCNAIKYV